MKLGVSMMNRFSEIDGASVWPRLASMRSVFSFLFAALFCASNFAQDLKAISHFEKFEPKKAPAPKGLMLKQGDRLAICGDSITEQKMYSRIMETYLTVA